MSLVEFKRVSKSYQMGIAAPGRLLVTAVQKLSRLPIELQTHPQAGVTGQIWSFNDVLPDFRYKRIEAFLVQYNCRSLPERGTSHISDDTPPPLVSILLSIGLPQILYPRSSFLVLGYDFQRLQGHLQQPTN